ncbi:Transmembrane GTPase Marf, partial [Trichoplax sp. H2]
MAQGNKTELVQFMDLSDRFTILTNQLIEDLRINRELSPFCRHLRSIQHQHQRNRLKVVFFGRTSKGKSTTINALLGRKVLPSAKGRTTSCFCILKGYDNLRSNGTSSDQDDENIMDEGYFQANNNVKRIPLKELSKKMKALRQSGNEEVKVINVFLPKNKHEILKEEIEIMDTPGGSTDNNIDSSIKDLYADTDVCVYLLNVNDTIEKDDQEFIKKMLMQHHQAEMFILVNYCDELDDCSEDEANEVKNQNLINSQIALNGLNDRVFFVSSKEALAAKVNGLTSEELRDENEKERLRAFETFEREIRERVCISTRKAKLAQSMDKVIEVNGDIREMILQNLLRWSNDLGTNSKINLQDGNNFYLQISQQREKYYEKLSSVSQCLNSSTHRWMESQLKSLEAKIYKD